MSESSQIKLLYESRKKNNYIAPRFVNLITLLRNLSYIYGLVLPNLRI